MTNIIRTTMVLVALIAATSSTSQVNAQSDGGGRLAGAWDAAVTIYNCDTGAPIRQFASVGTFHKGGTFTGITSGTPPAARSTEAGVWQHSKSNQYIVRFKAFLFDPTGNPVAYQIVTHDLDLDSDNLNYTSDGGVRIFNMAGFQIGAGCSSAVGTRMVLD